MGDADVINAHCWCVRSKIKCHASSLKSHTHLIGMDAGDSIQTGMPTLFVTESTMASKENKRQYAERMRRWRSPRRRRRSEGRAVMTMMTKPPPHELMTAIRGGGLF
jgi:hypothetical protein